MIYRRRIAVACLLALFSLIVPVGLDHGAFAQDCVDPFEPDDPGAEPAPWIGNSESQSRSFCPEGDVDRASFRVKAGHWYDVHTSDLGPLVDTVLVVEGAGFRFEDDDSGSESLASRIYFQAPTTGEVTLTVSNSHRIYGADQSYTLYAGEGASPTATPTATPTNTPTALPTATPRPTRTPPPTATPASPIINFFATPDHVDRPGDCVTLRWHVERATEVFLIYPNGAQEGVVGEDERQVCLMETGTYALQVNAPGGNETVSVQVAVPLPTHTPTPEAGTSSGGSPRDKGTVHVLTYVDENRSLSYDPQEGVLGVEVLLMSQADPALVWSALTDARGQVHLGNIPAGNYTLLIPHLGHAQTLSYRGDDVTLDVLVEAIQLPVRIP